MAEFTMKIAGQAGHVVSLFDSSRDYCRKYVTEDAPDFSVAVSREDLAFEQESLLEEARQEGLRPRIFPDPFLERAAIQRKFAEHLLTCGTLMLHGSTVAVDGKAYLFTARCGTGKSTHTRLWREAFGSRAVMVNDDKPFLRLTEQGVLACGAPWSGKHGLDSNVALPLQGICILRRGAENRIRQIRPEDAVEMLLHQSYAPLDASNLPGHRRLVASLAAAVPLWQMDCTKDPEAAAIAYAAMSRRP